MQLAMFEAHPSFKRLFEAVDRLAPDSPVLGICAPATWSSLHNGSIRLERFAFLLAPRTENAPPSSMVSLVDMEAHGVTQVGNAALAAYAAMVQSNATLFPALALGGHGHDPTLPRPGLVWFDAAQSLEPPDRRFLLAVPGAVLLLDVLPDSGPPCDLSMLFAASALYHRPTTSAHARMAALQDAAPAQALGARLLRLFFEGRWAP